MFLLSNALISKFSLFYLLRIGTKETKYIILFKDRKRQLLALENQQFAGSFIW